MKNALWPIDQKDGGCDCDPQCILGNPLTRQIDVIEIINQDSISDSGIKIAGLFEVKGEDSILLLRMVVFFRMWITRETSLNLSEHAKSLMEMLNRDT